MNAKYHLSLIAVALCGALFGEVVTLPSVGKFPGGEASIADSNLWNGVNITANNSIYYYLGDNFRFFLDGSDTTLTNIVKSGSTSFSDRSWVKPGTPQHLTIDIYNGAKLTTGGFTISRSIDGTLAEGASSHYLCVRDNATLETSGFSVPYDDAKIEVLSGATLVTTNRQATFGSGNQTHTISWYDNTKPTIADKLDLNFRIDHATWKTRGFWLGHSSNADQINISFAATNALIESSAAQIRICSPGDYVFGPGTVFKTDSSFALMLARMSSLTMQPCR